ncbi:G/U mismatch-specific uracil-DNA glycosylase [Flavobacterium fryxellicola]|uniref:DNA-deoxyinosine glycosylase n=1 Tax=Flavobacterium fryxellicola TaxID=249352 RepID=A0A162LA57_9FLAO|nr:DNA-deoxyinosine glycosylase [Flavobacterium fryxellicola]OAB26414.1 DNA-deoxyinosine glycosylase [Flavobacterium fryxellicola]SHN79308.1 G/U mismatch-specific uracil-DNA glycosylase [Flavobacterium fryxellicola]
MIHSFPPFVNAQTEILILGTMPGITSLEKQQYYAHQRNLFWKIMYTILKKVPISEIFEEKIALLQQHKIGLWDVLENCERQGSLDVNIKNHKENDFEMLFKEFPSISKIIFNGKESHKYFFKKFGQIEDITYYVMPSTSPAHTMTFENKLQLWSACFH